MYSPALAQASSTGIIFSTFLVAVAFGIYFLLNQDARILGASVIMLILSFVTRDYYHLVYAAGGMLVFALLMSLTDFDEGTIRGAFYYAGIGTFISLILYYLFPVQIPNGPSLYDTNFAIFVIWLDDVVAYFLYHENIYALTYLGPLGAVLIGVFLYMEVTE